VAEGRDVGSEWGNIGGGAGGGGGGEKKIKTTQHTQAAPSVDTGSEWSDGPGCIAFSSQYYGSCGGEAAAMKAMALRKP